MTWTFTPETTTNKENNLLFGGQEVVSLDAIGDLIIVMICPENSNLIDNVFRTNMPLPRVVYDHESKYVVTKGDVKKKTPKEILKLIKCYVPEDWALVLVELSSTISAIVEEGFKGTQSSSFEDNIEKNMRLSVWVRQYDAIVFQFLTQETDCYESENDMAQEEKGHEAHNDMDMDDEDDDGYDNDDEDNRNDDDDIIFLLEPKVVAPKET